MQKELWIINPKNNNRFNWDHKEMVKLMGKKALSSPLALPLLAALTPDCYDIKLIDENIESIRKGCLPDLVAITVWISNKERAFELADGFREKGVPVILGGPEVSDWPGEALSHADSIVIGEAEDVWPGVLEDYENKRLKAEYRSDNYCEFNTSPVPRWDLLDTEKVLSLAVQVSRGCPYSCDFCNVRHLFGKKFRFRNVDDVIRELSGIPEGLIVSFADDNFTANKAFTNELLDRMIPMGIKWNCQASIDCAYDIPLLEKMKKAGCSSILVGIESLDPETLSAANKKHNDVSRYRLAINNIQEHGIFVIGAFIAGFDNDDESIFTRLSDFVRDNHVAFIMLNALYAYPHSNLYERLKSENRILETGAYKHTGLTSNIIYRNFSGEELKRHILETLDVVYSWKAISEKGEVLLTMPGFSDEAGSDVTTGVKFRISLYFLFHYLMFASPAKRKFFLAMIRIIRKRKTPIEIIMQYILFNDSFKGYLRYLSAN